MNRKFTSAEPETLHHGVIIQRTPLLLAIELEEYDIARILIGAGAKTNHDFFGGGYPEVLTCESHKGRILPSSSLISYAIATSNREKLEYVNLLLEYDADVNWSQSPTGHTLLMNAVSRNRDDIVDALLNNG